MKSNPKSASPQLNLALLDHARAKLPQDQQQELALAVVELLVNAAAPGADAQSSTGGQNESEAE